MKNATVNRILKYVSLCLAVLTGTVLAVCIAAICASDYLGLYTVETQEGYEQRIQGQQQDLEQYYAAKMIAGGKENYDLMDGSNMEYMIVQPDTEREQEKILYTSTGLQSRIDADPGEETAFREKAHCYDIPLIEQSVILDQTENIMTALFCSRQLYDRYAQTEDENISYYKVYTDLVPELKKQEQDFFYEQKILNQTLYQKRFDLILTTILLTLVMIGLIAVYLHGIKQTKTEKISWMRKVPLILPLGFFIAAEAVIGSIISACIYYSLFYVSTFTMQLGLGIILANIMAGIIVFLLFMGECAARTRDSVFLRGTACYHLYHIAKKWLAKLWHSARSALRTCRENMDLLLRVFLIFIALTLLELLVIGATDYDLEAELFLFLCFKVMETPILFRMAIQFRCLQNAARQMAAGDLNHPIDTGKMFFECKTHGNYLNQIVDGMNLAVEERLKSERFKTELITNVSHDIKTPLTSIINYVDLLQKEGISNEEREEYIQVLDRQSGRLKKLIDDLMDASKASTGNVEIHLDKCNVGIMMIQTLGEYEEKMADLDLHLIAPESPDHLLVNADSRHLWRVFDNLMNNICKYAQPGTRVYVSQESDDRQVRIIFRNISKYSLGISSEELMERFVRGDSSRHTEGSGLGLSIAKDLTELMQGEFHLNTDGDLFKVTIILPRIK